jgi:hypothetical protein
MNASSRNSPFNRISPPGSCRREETEFVERSLAPSASLPWRLLPVRCLFGIAILAWSLVQTRAQYDPDWVRNFRAGAVVGFNIKASFKTGGNLTLSGSNPGPVGTNAANHFFDNGYVRIDDFGNSQGYTTYWGYQNASQYDAANNRLLYQGASSFDSGNASSSAKGNANLADIGFELAYGGYPWRWDRLRLGFEFGFMYMPMSISGKQLLDGNVAHSTYAFQVPNGVVIPGAPYNGGPSGFGQPAIFDDMSVVSNSVTAGTLSSKQTLDATLYSFRLGPSLFWDINESFGLTVGAGPAIGFVPGSLRFDETVFVSNTVFSHSKGSIGSTEIVYGGYINATLTYHVTQNGDFFVGAQYMPMSTATFGGGGREAKLNLKGAVYISGGINWPF